MDTLSLQTVSSHKNYLLAKAEYLREQRSAAIRQQAENVAPPTASKPEPAEEKSATADQVDVTA